MDIDETLINKKGELDPAVYDIFTKADLDRTQFILMTGNSADTANDCVAKINAILPEGKTIKPWISTSCGSIIINPNGEVVKQSNLEKTFMKGVSYLAEREDPKSIIMLRSGNKNYIDKQKSLSINGILMYLYKYKEAKKGTAGLQFTDIDKSKRDYIINSQEVQNMFVVSLSKKHKAKIDKEIQRFASQYYAPNHIQYPVYPGFATQTPAMSKENALQLILKFDPTLCDDITDVIYFGDGTNDVECLKQCKYSIARGENAKPAAIQAAKYHYTNLSTVAEALYSDEQSFESAMESLPACEAELSTPTLSR